MAGPGQGSGGVLLQSEEAHHTPLKLPRTATKHSDASGLPAAHPDRYARHPIDVRQRYLDRSSNPRAPPESSNVIFFQSSVGFAFFAVVEGSKLRPLRASHRGLRGRQGASAGTSWAPTRLVPTLPCPVPFSGRLTGRHGTCSGRRRRGPFAYRVSQPAWSRRSSSLEPHMAEPQNRLAMPGRGGRASHHWWIR